MVETAEAVSLEEQVQYLYDRSQVEDVLCRYARSCDDKDVATLHTLFTPTATARYGKKQEWLQGGATIADWIGSQVVTTNWQHHLINVYNVDLDGDRATAHVYLLSHQSQQSDPDTVLMFTSRYDMALERRGPSWQINELDLVVGWMEQRTASQAALP
jgi:3-phenylpropionate/cinnamic acid dioxygenase small subunit